MSFKYNQCLDRHVSDERASGHRESRRKGTGHPVGTSSSQRTLSARGLQRDDGGDTEKKIIMVCIAGFLCLDFKVRTPCSQLWVATVGSTWASHVLIVEVSTPASHHWLPRKKRLEVHPGPLGAPSLIWRGCENFRTIAQ